MGRGRPKPDKDLYGQLLWQQGLLNMTGWLLELCAVGPGREFMINRAIFLASMDIATELGLLLSGHRCKN